METNIVKPKKWYKNKKLWPVWAVILVVAIWAIFFRGGNGPTYETITAIRGDLVQEVSVTGKVKPAQAVDLQFESSGRIASVNYKVGDRVSAGAVIVSLENQELQADVTSARADLDKTLRDFNSLNNPSVYSSLRVELENAKTNLDQVKKKADGDLASEYNSSFNTAREAMTQVNTSLAVLEYLRKTYFESNYTINPILQQYQAETNSKIQKAKSVFPEIDNSSMIVTPEMYLKIELVLPEILTGSQALRSAFTYIQEQIQSNPSYISSATDRASVNTEASAVSSDLSAVSAAIQGISDQKILNSKNVADAEAKLASAQSSFPTAEDILQKEAALQSAQSRLRKSLIIAPFTGTIGKIDVERGQTVSSTTQIVSLISSAKYQIEANITEVDIGKIAIGNPTMLTLDAYGSQVPFNAIVSTVDTAATVVEGVTTYKTVFDFNGDVDSGIRPNMTANLDIQTARKENVISIPQRSVISRNGDKVVRIFKGPDLPYEERVVQLGISGKDGQVEVVSGLIEGEQVITFINE